MDRIPEYIRRRIDIAENGCWQWRGYITDNGYGRVGWRGKDRRVHRVVYELLVGEPPAGLDMDHLCRNRSCCNPNHLEPVTRLENIRRGEHRIASQLRQTHCIHGHEFTPENTSQSGNKRRCLACVAIRNQSQSHIEASRRWARANWERIKSDPVVHAAHLAKVRARKKAAYHAKKARPAT